MDIIDRRLIGKDLCSHECIDNNSVIHPETCADKVLTECYGSKTLTEWIDGDSDPSVHHGSFSTYHNLIDWLKVNYPVNTYMLPAATYSNIGHPVIGGVIINPEYLTVTRSGALSINRDSLNIPTITESSHTTGGIIKLGNDTILNSTFSNIPITENNTFNFPLRIDSNGCAGIAMSDGYFSQTQVDWNQTNTSAVDYIKNKPSIPEVNDATITFMQGSNVNTITLNQNSNQIISFDTAEHYNNFTGATEFTSGASGLVVAPLAGDENKFLCGNGNWEDIPTPVTYNDFNGGEHGLVPPATSTDHDKYLRGDGSWEFISISQVKSNWTETDNTLPSYILNKPTIGVGLTTNLGPLVQSTSYSNIKADLYDESSLGTIGQTSKLYAVGVDSTNKLCVKVPWIDTDTTYSNGNAINLSNNTFSLDTIGDTIFTEIDNNTTQNDIDSIVVNVRKIVNHNVTPTIYINCDYTVTSSVETTADKKVSYLISELYNLATTGEKILANRNIILLLDYNASNVLSINNVNDFAVNRILTDVQGTGYTGYSTNRGTVSINDCIVNIVKNTIGKLNIYFNVNNVGKEIFILCDTYDKKAV